MRHHARQQKRHIAFDRAKHKHRIDAVLSNYLRKVIHKQNPKRQFALYKKLSKDYAFRALGVKSEIVRFVKTTAKSAENIT
jgi:hypothetical protein